MFDQPDADICNGNVNKKSPRLTTTKFSRPWFSRNRCQNFGNGAAKNKLSAFKIWIHNFQEQNTAFQFCSIRCKHRHRWYNYKRRLTTKLSFCIRKKFSKNFATRRRKTNADSPFLMNKISRSGLIFTSCRRRHRYYISIIPIFEKLRIFLIFWKRMPSMIQMLRAWNVISWVPHEFSWKKFVCRSSLFTKGKKQTEKSVILSHFSNLKFLFFAADVLNSACFDSISFCWKFEINF